MMEYDPQADAFSSWQDAVAAIRETHRAKVRKLLPALWRARQSRRLSRTGLAQAIGVSEPCIQMWENGNHYPSPEMFDRWRAYLRIDVVG